MLGEKRGQIERGNSKVNFTQILGKHCL